MGPLATVADLLLPPRCPACGREATAVWCGRCLGELAALALPDAGRVLLAPDVLAVAAYAYEGVVRDTLLDVKLRGRAAAVAGMGALMRARLELPAERTVTWVPSRRRRVRERGIDVARALAGRGAVALLQRVRATPDQKRLGSRERRRGQRGAFAACRPVPAAVVLVDDVRTTGATALEAASALRRAGARRVLVATFAAVSGPGGRQARSPPGRDGGGRGRWS